MTTKSGIVAELSGSPALARACDRWSVDRLRVFGSAAGGAFDPKTSDVDFLVEFLPDVEDVFASYFGLRDDLTLITGRSVDLVMRGAIRNPYFAASVFESAIDVYAA